MTYSEIETKVKQYRESLIEQYINENDSIEFKVGEVVAWHYYENGKKKILKHLYVRSVYLNKEGNLVGYFLHDITPTCRVSKHNIYYVPEHHREYICSNGTKCSELLTHHSDSLEEYKRVRFEKDGTHLCTKWVL